MAELRNNRAVDSKRSIFGVYFLSKPASEIHIGEVVRVLDGTIVPLGYGSVSNYKKCDDCNDGEVCVVHKLMVNIRNAISDALDHRTLADMPMLSPKRKQHIFW